MISGRSCIDYGHAPYHRVSVYALISRHRAYTWDKSIYRILPKISPPFFSSRHDLDWGGGLFSNMQFPSNISPPWPPLILQSPCGRTTTLLVTYRGKYPEFAGFFLQNCGSEMTCQVAGRQQMTIAGGERTCCSMCVRLQRKAKAS